MIAAFERVLAHGEGLQQRALAAVAAATTDIGLDADLARHEVGAALRLSPVTAADRTRVAAELTGRLVDTLAALTAGRINYLQARHLADTVRDLPDPLAGAVQARVLTRAPAQTAAETRRTARDAVTALDPVSAMDRHLKAVRERVIDRTPLADAMEGWWIPLAAHLAGDLWTALTARARADQAHRKAAAAAGKAEAGAGAGPETAEVPGLDALRVDALVAAIQADNSTGTTGRRVPRCSCGGAQTAAIILDLPTALGLADNPARLPGHGLIPRPLGRAMAADRDWVRFTTDPHTGALLDRGARSYRPSDRLRAFIAARDRVCGFPGCNAPAVRCDCDHIVAHRPRGPRGARGPTVRANLGPLCRSHHNAKTHGRWRLTYQPHTATKTWTSPLGKTYTAGTDPPLT